ncbi:uncharacterized protein LOC130257480 [Oenanthe melanoleuca]|uniref:uncharacterized protein LOC130257480 n=1 Tax=Oenanthe melanoleuca TaxID=2939378 RepID=UPI0024C1ECBE|nr:uncharacterized protein LOC130257480 [Oenanthe melanoleuca]
MLPGPLGLLTAQGASREGIGKDWMRALGRLCSAASPSPSHGAGSPSCSHCTVSLVPGPLQRPVPAAAVQNLQVQNLHLCEGYVGPDGRSHSGFYCPRLTDPPGHRYCCRPSPAALKSCCSQRALEALTGVNLSSLASPGLLRNPLALPFVGLYGLLVLLLMAIDLCHFCRSRRCHLRRLLPGACRAARRAPRGHRAGTRPARGAAGLTRPSRAC